MQNVCAFTFNWWTIKIRRAVEPGISGSNHPYIQSPPLHAFQSVVWCCLSKCRLFPFFSPCGVDPLKNWPLRILIGVFFRLLARVVKIPRLACMGAALALRTKLHPAWGRAVPGCPITQRSSGLYVPVTEPPKEAGRSTWNLQVIASPKGGKRRNLTCSKWKIRRGIVLFHCFHSKWMLWIDFFNK